jgi:hypothetical protein
LFGPLLLLADVVRVLSLGARVEQARTTQGPAPLLARLRQEGGTHPRRSAVERQRLQRAVRLVDHFFPGGGNCYRRVLLEVALDAGAAEEVVLFGQRADGGPGSGHAYFKSDQAVSSELAGHRFDVIFEM